MLIAVLTPLAHIFILLAAQTVNHHHVHFSGRAQGFCAAPADVTTVGLPWERIQAWQLLQQCIWKERNGVRHMDVRPFWH